MNNTKTALIVGGIIILFLFFAMPFGGRWGSMMGMMYPGYSNYGYGMMGGFGFGWIFMLLVIIALVLLIIWLFQQLHPTKRRR